MANLQLIFKIITKQVLFQYFIVFLVFQACLSIFCLIILCFATGLPQVFIYLIFVKRYLYQIFLFIHFQLNFFHLSQFLQLVFFIVLNFILLDPSTDSVSIFIFTFISTFVFISISLLIFLIPLFFSLNIIIFFLITIFLFIALIIKVFAFISQIIPFVFVILFIFVLVFIIISILKRKSNDSSFILIALFSITIVFSFELEPTIIFSCYLSIIIFEFLLTSVVKGLLVMLTIAMLISPLFLVPIYLVSKGLYMFYRPLKVARKITQKQFILSQLFSNQLIQAFIYYFIFDLKSFFITFLIHSNSIDFQQELTRLTIVFQLRVQVSFELINLGLNNVIIFELSNFLFNFMAIFKPQQSILLEFQAQSLTNCLQKQAKKEIQIQMILLQQRSILIIWHISSSWQYNM